MGWLEGQRRIGEMAQAIELRHSGENSVLSNLAMSASASLTQVSRWAYWWNSNDDLPDQVTNESVVMELNTDLAMKGMTAQELTVVVKAWQREQSAGRACCIFFESAKFCRRGGRQRRRRG
jgi:hypothetical protein